MHEYHQICISGRKGQDLPEILDGCGLIVKPSDPGQLSQAIDNILINPEKTKNLGIKARDKFLREYNWSKMQELLGDIIEDIRIDNRNNST